MSLYEKTLAIATKAHEGQKRKNGDDYITHPLRVAEKFEDELHKVVAILHDVIEDTDVTEEDLLGLSSIQFPEDAVKAITKLSRKAEDTYFDFIMRLSTPEGEDIDFEEWELMAIRVKIADLEDNMRDLSEGSMKDKYRLSHYLLTITLESSEIPGQYGRIYE